MVFTAQLWNLLLIILLSISVVSTIVIWIYYKVTNRLKNGLVCRIHMPDKTIQTRRYDIIPTDNKHVVEEESLKGRTTFSYEIKEESIEKGNWGKYIDWDYHVMIPINPTNRSSILNDFKELFKMIGAMLDTDLHVKLLRSSQFESFVKTMLIIIMIGVFLGAIFGGITMTKSFLTRESNDCVLKLDNETWTTLYIGTHVQPSTMTQTTPNK